MPFTTSRAILIVALFQTFSTMGRSQNNFTVNYPDTINPKRLYTTIGTEVGAYVSGLSFLSLIWYKDQERVKFHFYDDSRGYLQMDKAGHGYGAYRYSHSAYYALRWAGVDKKRSLVFGGPIGLLFQTPVEIFDGLYEGWGFSWTDMLANTVGAGFFSVQEALFDEQLILMKYSYSPSIYPDYHTHLGETQLERFFLDYNAHTYWLSCNLQRITGINKIPGWLNLALGYSANGMIYEFRNPEYYMGKPFPHLERYRQYIFSLDVDCSRIPTRNKTLIKVFRAINLIKIPFPAIEYNRVDGIKARGLYF